MGGGIELAAYLLAFIILGGWVNLPQEGGWEYINLYFPIRWGRRLPLTTYLGTRLLQYKILEINFL